MRRGMGMRANARLRAQREWRRKEHGERSKRRFSESSSLLLAPSSRAQRLADEVAHLGRRHLPAEVRSPMCRVAEYLLHGPLDLARTADGFGMAKPVQHHGHGK